MTRLLASYLLVIVLGTSTLDYAVKAQVPADASECPLTCSNGSNCFGHTTTSQGQAFDAVLGEIYWHENSNRTGYFCECPLGFTGIECSELSVVCNPTDPPDQYLICENGGICIEGQDDFGFNFFVCDCNTNLNLGERYVGQHCEIPVPRSQYCLGCAVDSFCVRGGTCRQASAGNVDIQPCDCPPGRSGKHCEFSTASLDCTLSCGNNGICRHGQKRIDTVPDQIIHQSSQVSPSRAENYMFCECEEGYAGTFCEYEYVRCGESDQYCFNNSVCQQVGAEWVCLCDIETSPAAGDYCEFIATDQCTAVTVYTGIVDDTILALPVGQQFCVNGGQCNIIPNDSGDPTFFCDCGSIDLAGTVYSGQHCESRQAVAILPSVAPATTFFPTIIPANVPTIQPTDVSLPTASPGSTAVCNPEAPENERINCQNGGVCVVRGDGAFGCVCPVGVTGRECETVVQPTDAPVPFVPTATPTLSAVPTTTPVPSYPLLTFSPRPTTFTSLPTVSSPTSSSTTEAPSSDAVDVTGTTTPSATVSSSPPEDEAPSVNPASESAACKSWFALACAVVAVLVIAFL